LRPPSRRSQIRFSGKRPSHARKRSPYGSNHRYASEAPVAATSAVASGEGGQTVAERLTAGLGRRCSVSGGENNARSRFWSGPPVLFEHVTRTVCYYVPTGSSVTTHIPICLPHPTVYLVQYIGDSKKNLTCRAHIPTPFSPPHDVQFIYASIQYLVLCSTPKIFTRIHCNSMQSIVFCPGTPTIINL
jgi:hypothetical protein